MEHHETIICYRLYTRGSSWIDWIIIFGRLNSWFYRFAPYYNDIWWNKGVVLYAQMPLIVHEKSWVWSLFADFQMSFGVLDMAGSGHGYFYWSKGSRASKPKPKIRLTEWIFWANCYFKIIFPKIMNRTYQLKTRAKIMSWWMLTMKICTSKKTNFKSYHETFLPFCYEILPQNRLKKYIPFQHFLNLCHFTKKNRVYI